MFGTAFAALFAAHHVADHWIQTQGQASRKVLPSWEGRVACAAHVGTYTLTLLVALATVGALGNVRLTLLALVANGITHYVADRRVVLRRLADWLGKDPGWLDRGGGMYALDQAWHVGWLFLTAMAIA